MDDEATEAVEKKKSRMRLMAVMMLLIVLGIGLYATPIFLYPNNVVYEDSLSDFNAHTTNTQITLEEGTYEVWMTTSLWTWFNLDQPLVYVNSTTEGPIHIDTVLRGDDRTIEGDECRHFATFTIKEKATYNVTVIAGLMALGIPGTENVYVVEERPAAYAPMQWAGIIMVMVGVVGIILLMILAAFISSEERKKERIRQSPPPGAYPPPGYMPYPPQQQPPPYSQYPPPQQPPPYPPPQQQPPPPGQERRGPPQY